MGAWLVILALAVYGVWCAFHERWRVAPFRRRRDHRRLWLAAIPSREHGRVEDLLSSICDAFMVPSRYRFRLRPSDDIHALYRRNMRGQFGDSWEYLHLVRHLERLGVDPERLLAKQPCTVGALVRCLTKPNGEGTSGRSAAASDSPAMQPGDNNATKGPPSAS